MQSTKVKRKGNYDGRPGGKGRAKKLTDDRRKEIAVSAANKRWKDHKKDVIIVDDPHKEGDLPSKESIEWFKGILKEK